MFRYRVLPSRAGANTEAQAGKKTGSGRGVRRWVRRWVGEIEWRKLKMVEEGAKRFCVFCRSEIAMMPTNDKDENEIDDGDEEERESDGDESWTDREEGRERKKR